MNDLKERFRQLDELEAPDLRGHVAHFDAASNRLPLRRRAVIAALALAIAVVPFVVVVRLFGHSTQTANSAGSTVGGITLLVSRGGPTGDDARGGGTLTAVNGCLAIHRDPVVYVVWPKGYSLARVNGRVWLTDDRNAPVAAMGDRVVMGGASDSLPYAEKDVPGGIPESCQVPGPDHYWIAGVPSLVKTTAGQSGAPSPVP